MKVFKSIFSMCLSLIMLLGTLGINSLAVEISGSVKKIDGIDNVAGYTPSDDTDGVTAKSLYIDFDVKPSASLSKVAWTPRLRTSYNNGGGHGFIGVVSNTGAVSIRDHEAWNPYTYAQSIPLEKLSHITVRLDWNVTANNAVITTYVNGINLLEAQGGASIGYQDTTKRVIQKNWAIYAVDYNNLPNDVRDSITGVLVATGSDGARYAKDAEYSTNLRPKSGKKGVEISGTLGSFKLICVEGYSLSNITEEAEVMLWTGSDTYTAVTGADIKAYRGLNVLEADEVLQNGDIIKVTSANGRCVNEYTVELSKAVDLSTLSDGEITSLTSMSAKLRGADVLDVTAAKILFDGEEQTSASWSANTANNSIDFSNLTPWIGDINIEVQISTASRSYENSKSIKSYIDDGTGNPIEYITSVSGDSTRAELTFNSSYHASDLSAALINPELYKAGTKLEFYKPISLSENVLSLFSNGIVRGDVTQLRLTGVEHGGNTYEYRYNFQVPLKEFDIKGVSIEEGDGETVDVKVCFKNTTGPRTVTMIVYMLDSYGAYESVLARNISTSLDDETITEENIPCTSGQTPYVFFVDNLSKFNTITNKVYTK